MTTTIDKAGRIVIPQSLRQQFHLGAGSSLDLIPDGDGIRLRLARVESELIEKSGILVQAAENPVAIDSTTFINQQREARSLENGPFPPLG